MHDGQAIFRNICTGHGTAPENIAASTTHSWRCAGLSATRRNRLFMRALERLFPVEASTNTRTLKSGRNTYVTFSSSWPASGKLRFATGTFHKNDIKRSPLTDWMCIRMQSGGGSGTGMSLAKKNSESCCWRQKLQQKQNSNKKKTRHCKSFFLLGNTITPTATATCSCCFRRHSCCPRTRLRRRRRCNSCGAPPSNRSDSLLCTSPQRRSTSGSRPP